MCLTNSLEWWSGKDILAHIKRGVGAPVGLKLTINEKQDLELEFVDFGPGPPTFAPKYLLDFWI